MRTDPFDRCLSIFHFDEVISRMINEMQEACLDQEIFRIEEMI